MQKLCMSAGRLHAALRDHHDFIRIFNGLQPVRDDHNSLAPQKEVQAVLQLFLVLDVQRGGDFVQNDNGGIL